MHKTFISYHHKNEQELKNNIIEKYGGEFFIDSSVSDGEIDVNLDEDKIMKIIRENYLHDSTVTVVLIGFETSDRPFVNSEIQASLRDTRLNKHNGLLAVIRDDLYDTIYSSSTCSDCGTSVRNRDSVLFETYIPNLVKKNHNYYGNNCHYNGGDVYCTIIRYSTFLGDVEKYINEAFDKRDDDSFEIKKIPDVGTPKLGNS